MRAIGSMHACTMHTLRDHNRPQHVLYFDMIVLCAPCAASMHVEYPMLFSVTNRATGGSTHCGVLEFIADEGHVYMPYWVRCLPRPIVEEISSCLPAPSRPFREVSAVASSLGHR